MSNVVSLLEFEQARAARDRRKVVAEMAKMRPVFISPVLAWQLMVSQAMLLGMFGEMPPRDGVRCQRLTVSLIF